MNRSELVNAVAEKTDTPRTQVKAVLAATLDQIMAATATGEKVILAVFGTFEGSNRAAREGRNPATGEPLQIAASRGVGFKPGRHSSSTSPAPSDNWICHARPRRHPATVATIGTHSPLGRPDLYRWPVGG